MTKPFVFSIRPEFVQAFRDRRKSVEYRTRRPSVKRGDPMLIYETAPTSKVVAIATRGRLYAARPTDLWRQTAEMGGIEREAFVRYFSEYDGLGNWCAWRPVAYAIEMTMTWLDEPISLPACMRAPQSWARWKGPWPLPGIPTGGEG